MGQEVVLVDPQVTFEQTRRRAVRRLRVGEVGTVRKIVISDCNDGDDTFPMFYVRFRRATTLLGSCEDRPGGRPQRRADDY